MFLLQNHSLYPFYVFVQPCKWAEESKSCSLPEGQSLLASPFCPSSPPLLECFSLCLPLRGKLPESTGVCGPAQMAVFLMMTGGRTSQPNSGLLVFYSTAPHPPPPFFFTLKIISSVWFDKELKVTCKPH